MAIKHPKYRIHTRNRNILEKNIKIGELLKYVGYGLGGLALFFIIVMVPFLLGRASVSCDQPVVSLDSKPLPSVIDAAAEAAPAAPATPSPAAEETAPLVEEQTPLVAEQPEEAIDPSGTYLRNDPRVATTYTDVDINLIDYKYEKRGADWGTITSLTVEIKNNQPKIIIPYSVKTKIYDKYSAPNDWWDDESSVRDKLNIVVPFGSVQITIDTHITFSNFDTAKKVELYLFDEVGKQMSKKVEEITI